MEIDLEAARQRAFALLSGAGDRWLHTQTAALAAGEAAATVAPADRGLLVASAWLHDVGYVHPSPPTGFHALDGALLLLNEGWPRRLASLVAHHSEGRFGASDLGLESQLQTFDREDRPVTDALIYADMTAGPDGRRLYLRERLDDVYLRHAGEPARLLDARMSREPFLVLAAARVDLRLLRLGRGDHQALPVGSVAGAADLAMDLTPRSLPISKPRTADETQWIYRPPSMLRAACWRRRRRVPTFDAGR